MWAIREMWSCQHVLSQAWDAHNGPDITAATNPAQVGTSAYYLKSWPIQVNKA